MDCLHINGIRAYGYVGFFAAEKTLGQWFQVDLAIGTDLQPAAEHDDLQRTIDYAHLITLVKGIVASSQVDLVETLAVTILDQLMQIEGIESIQIWLTKESPPIPDFSGSITVEMMRSKI